MIIIVPYRNREENLKVFLEEYKNFEILIVEQANHELFNRAKLFNVGFDYINNKLPDKKIFCFHDVDLIAHDKNIYSQYTESVIHLSGLCEQFDYVPLYPELFGGVLLFNKDFFIKCNGFSNDFWGWGGEDDDMYQRVKLSNIDPQKQLNKYFSLNHDKQKITEQYQVNKTLWKKAEENWQSTGLINLNYEVMSSMYINEKTEKIYVNI